MASPLLIMDQVTGKSTLVTRHNQLDGSIELTGYGTHMSVSYEVQPNHQPGMCKKELGIYENVMR
jgi:hypothetical protein